MANTLTGLIPTLYEALNVVSRELVGFIPAVHRDISAERAAVNQTVRIPVGDSGELEDITPGATPADSGDTDLGYVDMTITKSKAAPIRWSGEEEKAVGTNGTYNKILADQFTGAMRKLVNAVEADLSIAAKIGASRAYGTAGTAPFGTAGDLSDFAGVLQILEANGAPKDDLQLVLGSSAIANLRGKQSVLFKVNEAGSSDMLRTGMTDRVQGFALRNSGGIILHTKGAGTGALINNADKELAGQTSLTYDTLTANTSGIKAGDIITFAGDTVNKYVVGETATAAAGELIINSPGLLVDIADNNAITVGGNYTPNVAFARNALCLIARAPAVPSGGDSADDSMMITDPLSGLTFEVRVYRQYRRVKFEVCLAWGVKAIKPAHIATLIG